MDIKNTLLILSNLRPIFHSEADFQHALAWEIQKGLSNASIRLELPILISSGFIHLDIWVQDTKDLFALELKYKKSQLNLDYNGEQYNLSNQGAQDLARYDFVKDIWRLEQIKGTKKNITCYAIFLTNDSSYWNPGRSENTIDSAFRLDDDKKINGKLDWGIEASEGTINGREDSILISGNYIFRWENYSDLTSAPNSKFRFLCVKI